MSKGQGFNSAFVMEKPEVLGAALVVLFFFFSSRWRIKSHQLLVTDATGTLQMCHVSSEEGDSEAGTDA